TGLFPKPELAFGFCAIFLRSLVLWPQLLADRPCLKMVNSLWEGINGKKQLSVFAKTWISDAVLENFFFGGVNFKRLGGGDSMGGGKKRILWFGALTGPFSFPQGQKNDRLANWLANTSRQQLFVENGRCPKSETN
ncbi:hypothetical protein Tsp_15356, partial [Trichinella spiralis]|uniref:hypothetical protein n=1 Tax=Trichinella spiralis TaxID=6334 RepID=UPI0001EFE67A